MPPGPAKTFVVAMFSKIFRVQKPSGNTSEVAQTKGGRIQGLRIQRTPVGRQVVNSPSETSAGKLGVARYAWQDR